MVKLSTLADQLQFYLESYGDKEIASIDTLNGPLQYILNLHDIHTDTANDHPHTGSDSIRLYDETVTAYKVLSDNNLIQRMSAHDLEQWITLADAIQFRIAQTDEKRFTLYDYLDSCLNGRYPWPYFADRFQSPIPALGRDKVMDELIEETVYRTIYRHHDQQIGGERDW